MKMKLILVMSLLCIATTINAGTLRFATEATYPPFEFVNAKGELQGFDIELAKILCQKMNVECSFSKQAFNSLIPSLNLRKFDAIIASIGVTPARMQQVSFTSTYYTPSACFVAANKNHYTLASLQNKVIGVQAGTTFEQYLRKKYAGVLEIKSYGSIQEAFLDLASGRVDLVLADTPIAKTWLQQNNNHKTYNIIDQPITNDEYFGTGYAIAIQKNNTQLLQKLNQALEETKADGSYDKLVQKYFGS